MYYIAYGSNLNSKVRENNNCNFKYITKCRLEGYKLAFKSYNSYKAFLTIDKCSDSYVDTIIYEIDKCTLDNLDIYEEVDNGLYTKEYIDINIDNNIYKCLVYIMNKESKLTLPQNEYFIRVLDGYIENNFNTDILYKAMSDINFKMEDLMTNCYYYLSNGLDNEDNIKTRSLLDEINNTRYIDFKTRSELGKKLFGSVGENLIFNKPFHCDHGYNIHIGDNFYANFNLTILDTSRVIIGNNVFIGPNVTLACPIHPIDSDCRNTFFEASKNIIIGDNVWICSNVTINGGVTIGNNVVIGSGSVVTRSFSDNVVIAGNPARVIRNISEEDKIEDLKQIEISRRLINNIK